jgi:hypothetical protein
MPSITLPRLSGRSVVLLFLSFLMGAGLIFTLGPAATLQEGWPDVVLLDVTTGYTAEHAEGVMAAYGPEGRSVYRRFLAMDYLFAALFAVGIGALLVFVPQRLGLGTRVAYLAALPPLLAGLLDWVENTLLLAMTGGGAERIASITPWSAAITSLKMPLMNLSFLMALFALFAILGLSVWRAFRRPVPSA